MSTRRQILIPRGGDGELKEEEGESGAELAEGLFALANDTNE